MSLRFALNTAFALSGGFLVVASQVFSTGTAGWLAFAVGLGVVILSVGALARTAGVSYLAPAAVGLWSLIAALLFTGSTLSWLVFADGLGLLAVALAALALHEVSTERVVHTLEVRGTGATQVA